MASPSDPTIARATPADAAEVVALLRGQFAEHAIALDDDSIASGVARLCAESTPDLPSRGCVLVARDWLSDGVGKVIGVACLAWIWTLEHGGESAWLDELYVLPSARERGVGTRLLHAAYAEATARGCRAIDLEVDAAHARVEELYAREGFRAHQRTRWVRSLR